MKTKLQSQLIASNDLLKLASLPNGSCFVCNNSLYEKLQNKQGNLVQVCLQSSIKLELFPKELQVIPVSR